ncbi:PREDICTED: uncharacterized protein LOC102241032 isoform X1 [Myotis brandtii]|uniref:uncharacterized protein LOC102241032 isoform X1 n=1 Tax=Myotis brandtii TaxID=109478 RepID=UPI0003BBFF05|nr:PREDICTED: uncharacterized protein LOC102241032 isoform X1 [Myotis brandtii]
MNEISWKDVANVLSLANLIMGLFSIFCSLSKKSSCASWMLLIGFLMDMAVRTITRHLNICSKSGAELNDFAVFTTFGLATALLLGVDGPLNGFLAIIYVLAASFRLCFYSTSGLSFTYKGLPCPYASCVLASTSLLTKGNRFILSCMASLMILFMMDQSYYPHDEILESENWKKIVYLGGLVKSLPNEKAMPALLSCWCRPAASCPHLQGKWNSTVTTMVTNKKTNNSRKNVIPAGVAQVVMGDSFNFLFTN